VTDGPRPLPVSEPAPAKLNVFLRVLGLRDDGFHDIETLVQPVTLADGIRAAHRDVGFGLSVAGTGAGEVPQGPDNLVLRAARVLAQATGERRGANLFLAKRIPVAAGLGGGSADAAATLRALDRLWGWGLGVDGLADVAIEIGSDVAALLPGGPVLARGRGELVEPVAVGRTWWVLLSQEFGVSAAEAYGWWDGDSGVWGPDPGALLDALGAGDPVTTGSLLFNDLEAPVAARHPEVLRAREALTAAGALGVVMSGSGPTVAGLARDGAHAEELARAAGGMAVGSVLRAP
jgi:4-diphosphocytidyl-2-C-methyl-D-erythritol kinase